MAAAEEAVAADPASGAARWRLLRALFFHGEFAAEGEGARRAVFDRAAQLADESLARLEARLTGDEGAGLAHWLGPAGEDAPVAADREAMGAALARAGVASADAARLHFWAAIAWAAWSRVHGLLGAVREGVAGRLYENARVAAALDPDVDRGGPYRLISRLHATLPKLPFLSGFVDRARALPTAELARAQAPDFPGNALHLALTLLDVAPERSDEALALLRQVATIEPSPDRVVEEEAMRATALERLREEGAAAPAAR